MRQPRRPANVPPGEAADFLRRTPPFSFLEEPRLGDLAAKLVPAYYPNGTLILEQGGPPSPHLLVIKKGSVKVSVRSPENGEVLVDHRGEGDAIGFLSLYTGDRSRTNVVATSDTICYLVLGEDFRGLLDANPLVRGFFHRTLLGKYLDRTLEEMRSRSLLAGGGERLLFTTPVGELAARSLVTSPEHVTVREAASTMARHRISSLVLVDASGAPTGIVTDRDIRDRVVAAGLGVDGPVAGIMSTGLVTAEASEPCFEALLTMLRRGIHHLVVVEGGAMRGIVTNHDLLLLQGSSPLSVAQEVGRQRELGGLARAARKVGLISGLLLKDGTRAAALNRVVTELNDRVVRRALAIAEGTCGPAPVPWAWLALGEDGRGEQAHGGERECGLVTADAGVEDADRAGRWSEAFAAAARDALAACGLPPSERLSPSDPRLRGPLSSWQASFSRAIGSPDGEEAWPMACFDFRVQAGEGTLGARLRGHVFEQLDRRPAFLDRAARLVEQNRPPLGFLGMLVVEKTGEHRDRFDLSERGIAPLVDLVRVHALAAGVPDTGTFERIEAIRGRQPALRGLADELVQALDFLLLLRLHHRRGEDAGAGDFIAPARLSSLERRALKAAFQLLSRMQDQVLEGRGAPPAGGPAER